MQDRKSEAMISTNDLRKGGLVLVISVVTGFAANYFFNLVLSNGLTPHQYGDYKVAHAFVTLAGVVVLLGGDRVAPKLLSSPLVKGDTRVVWEFFRFYLGVSILLSILVFGITTIAAYLHLGTMDVEQHHPLVMMSLVTPLVAIGALLSRILQSARFLALSNLPWRIVLPLLHVLLVIGLMLSVPQLELWHVIASGAFAAAVIVLWQWRKVWQLNLIRMERFPELFDGKETLKHSLPMMLAMLVALALNQVDLYMLEILGEEHDVGYFAAASTTAHIIPVAQTTVAGLFLPLIQPAMEKGAVASRQLYWHGQKLIMIIVIVLTIALVGTGERLLSLFGESYQVAGWALDWLILAQLAWALAAFSSTWLQYASRGHVVVLAGCLALALDVLCNLWLIPAYGINGAAVATLISLASAGLMIVWLFAGYQKRLSYP